jgi:hypothetical protein
MSNLITGRPCGDPPALDALAAKVRSGTLKAARRVEQSDGDVRYWGVPLSESPALERLQQFADERYRSHMGQPPGVSLIMINHIAANRSPKGSGGEWHRDSYREQYKAFMYVTDVRSEAQGAFCFLPGSNRPHWRAAAVLHRAATGANRYRSRTIERMLRFGVAASPVLLDAGIPFFVNTSLIHRGLPITQGDRIMAAVYLLEDAPDWYKEYGGAEHAPAPPVS